jgi:hypothetical protein
MAEPDFDWHSDESIVCHSQTALAVYPNTRGGIVIGAEKPSARRTLLPIAATMPAMCCEPPVEIVSAERSAA